MYLRHLSIEYRSILSADMSTDISSDTRPICRPRFDISTDVNRHACRPTPGRYFTATRPTVGRYFTDIRQIMCIYNPRWISFCFCATDLGFKKRTSVKKPCSVTVCTVGKLSSVDVRVMSSVLTVLGIQKPTSFYKPYRVTVISPRFGVVTKPCSVYRLPGSVSVKQKPSTVFVLM